MRHIRIDSPEEQEKKKELDGKHDPDSKRLKRFLNMPDLTQTKGSPLHELSERICAIHDFADFDVVGVPEIVPADISFDLFDFPADHPARSRSDTYFLDDTTILRPHTTVSWYYYMTSEYAKKKIEKDESIGVLTFGKVYRRDEIDRHHMNVFHQVDGYFLIPKKQGIIVLDDLEKILVKIARAVFGKNILYRFNEDTFPYTYPSIEMEISLRNPPSSRNSGTSDEARWVEVLGAGVVKGSVLEKLGVDSKNYTGWAFGFGLERLAILSMDLPDIRLLWSEDERVKSQLKLGNAYKEVSKYPSITRDVSFVVPKDFIPNNYFDLIRDIGGHLVEEVRLLDKYEDAKKFGKDKISYTYHIVYRSMERTLLSEEVDKIQGEIYKQTKEQLKAEIR